MVLKKVKCDYRAKKDQDFLNFSKNRSGFFKFFVFNSSFFSALIPKTGTGVLSATELVNIASYIQSLEKVESFISQKIKIKT